MYSESDLAAAVEAGVLSPDAANAFRNHVAEAREAPAVDEEHFKLLTGFNDIFVAIAAALVLAAVAWLGADLAKMLLNEQHESPRLIGGLMMGGSLSVAAASWLLAEYFTRRRRMALPSILLLLAFVGGAFGSFAGMFVINAPWIEATFGLRGEMAHRQAGGVILALIGVATAIATYVHWRRFMVPITVAAGAMALVGIAIGIIVAVVPGAENWLYWMALVAGLIVFAFAMRWDMSDLERRTRRSDVAFWLHLLAAPLIAHPVFHLIGVFDGDIPIAMAAVVIILYVGFASVALAVDRRALLVSSLVYVLYALYAIFAQTGAVELSAALTALVIGSALLTLSAFWQPMRRGVVGLLGGLETRLPPVQQPALA
ncbi:hypothetical protein [Stakelama tenebrarum]|uniref:DUF2157 domain-containing protein n=1 Tax=Stakelama tenebrarum TaxID=2711215 RepID=A0A6G6Y427_9SPHN|nr:hypothetical protein [Sphingosinithalassobacter tenebrarum]QIG79478.1 hypothetical protein G5C33_06530 [Sphingosinithalassobacter tenebrarum]